MVGVILSSAFRRVIWEGCLKLWQVLKDLGLFKGTKRFQWLIDGPESGWNMRFESLRSCRWFYDIPSISPHIKFCKTPEVNPSSTKLMSNWYTTFISMHPFMYPFIHSPWICQVAKVSKKDPFDSERRVIIVGGFEECVKAQNAVRSWESVKLLVKGEPTRPIKMEF